jgi:hypothetical protein
LPFVLKLNQEVNILKESREPVLIHGQDPVEWVVAGSELDASDPAGLECDRTVRSTKDELFIPHSAAQLFSIAEPYPVHGLGTFRQTLRRIDGGFASASQDRPISQKQCNVEQTDANHPSPAREATVGSTEVTPSG